MSAATLTHVVFNVSGAPALLADFDARLKLLFVEHGVTGECEEQHAAGALHYDLKVTGGIPFPPFALASGDFPDLTIVAEWVDAGSGVRGTATIARGTLTEQKVENVTAAGASHAVAIRMTESGYLELALVAIRTGRDECRGYMLTGKEDALFRINRVADGVIELWATQGAAEWGRAWRLPSAGAADYRAIAPPQTIAGDDFRELEKLAQDFVAQWIWFGSGPREEIAIEAERYGRMGYAVSDANLKSAALHRIKGAAGNGDDGVRYSTLDPEIAWIEDAIARCWPGGR